MLKLEKGRLRVAYWLLGLSVVIAWLARHGGGGWHEWPGFIATVLAAVLLVSPRNHLVGAICLSLVLVGVSGIAMSSERLWGLPWLGQLHAVLVLVWLALCGLLFGAKLLHRDKQLNEFIATLFQRGKRLR